MTAPSMVMVAADHINGGEPVAVPADVWALLCDCMEVGLEGCPEAAPDAAQIDRQRVMQADMALSMIRPGAGTEG